MRNWFMEEDPYKLLVEKGRQNAIIEFEQALSLQKTININVEQSVGNLKPQLGDSLIRASSITSLIREYSHKHDLPVPSFGYSTDNTINAEMYPLSFLSSSVGGFEERPMAKSFIQESVQDMAVALNEPVPEHLQKLERIVGHPYLNDFNRDEVEKRKKSILNEKKGKIIVIAQTGSTDLKRWNNERIERLAELAKQRADNVIILSDAQIKGEELKEHPLLEYSKTDPKLQTVFFSGIEDLAAYTGVADVFLTTDSAPGWVWGMERSQDSKALIQHSVATDFWKVPGAEIVESETVSKAKEENLIDKHGMIKGNNEQERRKLYNQLSNQPDDNTEMSENEFLKYYHKAEKFIL